MTEAPLPHQEISRAKPIDLARERMRLVENAPRAYPHELLDAVLSLNEQAQELSPKQRKGQPLERILYRNYRTGLVALTRMKTSPLADASETEQAEFSEGKGYVFTFFKDRIADLEQQALAESRELDMSVEQPSQQYIGPNERTGQYL